MLTTRRARETLPALEQAAAAVHLVGHGLVDELAGDLMAVVEGAQTLVALGGGRVVDTAKALAAARPAAALPRVAAIPTTLSAAEMTSLHRQARGAPADRHVRPALVVNDPALSASQPVEQLAASSANALGHALEAQVSALTSPVPTLAGREAAGLLRDAWALEPAEPDRDALALGALLSGYAIDGAWYGLHHVLAQTLVRVGDVGHGAANAVLLPHTLAALAQRSPDLDPDGAWRALARQLADRAGVPTLAALGVDDAAIEACADAATQRRELANTPPAADREELLGLLGAAARTEDH
ncbi:MAG: iron-containing alcohol dehydrogenase [Actinomycetota bacterium]|nr:iron-containing alcohol dehydrogenase [Actinomycetota bacterium]